MLRLLLPLSLLAACTPSPRKTVMPSPSPISATAQGPDEAAPQERGPPLPDAAAPGPMPAPVSAAGIAAPAPPKDSAAAALGRRTLSTAFVRVGPDGHLTIDLQDGRALVLRDVVMGPKKYCGVELSGKRHCGGYAEVAAARPGGAAAAGQPEAVGLPARPLP